MLCFSPGLIKDVQLFLCVSLLQQYHPSVPNIIATGGGRDKLVKVWDLNDPAGTSEEASR